MKDSKPNNPMPAFKEIIRIQNFLMSIGSFTVIFFIVGFLFGIIFLYAFSRH